MQERCHIQDVCHFAAQTVGKSGPTIDRNRNGNRCKIVPRGSPGHSKLSQKWSWEPLRALQGAQGAPWDDPECHRRASGSSREHPRSTGRVLKGDPRCQKECPGAPGGDQNRVQDASRSGKSAFSVRASLAHCFRIGFSTIFVDFQVLRKMREPSKVPRLSAKSRVRPFALRVTSLERCRLENHEN